MITITATFENQEQAVGFLKPVSIDERDIKTIEDMQTTIDKFAAENKSLKDENFQLDYDIGELEKKLTVKPDLSKVVNEARIQGRQDAIKFMNDNYHMAKVSDWQEKARVLLNLPTNAPDVAPENKVG